MPAAHQPEPHNDQQFDGIICIGGEDWWYHNRGHFDFQIMRRLARRQPVLFINSIGVRVPSLNNKAVFAARLARKFKSLSRGITNVENGFWVYSPVSVPGRTGQSLSNWALAAQIKVAARRVGINKPLLWIHCPAGAGLIDHLDPQLTVLQRTDRFEAFPEGDPALLSQQIQRLKQRADLVIYAAPHLMTEERGTVRDQLLVTHGVDLETFIDAGKGAPATPADIAELDIKWRQNNPGAKPGKRVGFIGGLDAHTFDPGLFNQIAASLPDLQFILVGGSSLPKDWCKLKNVAMLGRKPYDEIPAYMAAMDALIMPWNDSDWIKACNPIKLKEYLATGRPVITRDFAALDPWREFVTVASDAKSFKAAIRNALDIPFDAEPAQRALATESWDAKAELIEKSLSRTAAQIKLAPVKPAMDDAA